MTYRSKLLASAIKTVDGDRDKEFGDPLKNMKCAAQLIGSYLGARRGDSIEASDVPGMLALFKIARLAGNRGSTDSWRDLAGYAAVGSDVEKRSRVKVKQVKVKQRRTVCKKKRGRPKKTGRRPNSRTRQPVAAGASVRNARCAMSQSACACVEHAEP